MRGKSGVAVGVAVGVEVGVEVAVAVAVGVGEEAATTTDALIALPWNVQ
jgi:hypothetical protein